jgi:hypothetical protein
VQRLFRRRIAQPEPLLQVVDPQHRRDADGDRPVFALG